MCFWVLLTAVVGLFCVGAGVYLLGSQTVGPNSYLELLAHGMGLYFIGKGLFVWVSLARQHNQLEFLRGTSFGSRGSESAED